MRTSAVLLLTLFAACTGEPDTDTDTLDTDGTEGTDLDCDSGALDAPSDVTATANRNNEVLISWTAPQGAAGYIVERSDSEDGPFDEIGRTINPTFTDTGLAEGVQRYYIVLAANSDGESCWSTPAFGETL